MNILEKNIIGLNIKKLRKVLKLSQGEFGIKLGTDQAYISKLEFMNGFNE